MKDAAPSNLSQGLIASMCQYNNMRDSFLNLIYVVPEFFVEIRADKTLHCGFIMKFEIDGLE